MNIKSATYLLLMMSFCSVISFPAIAADTESKATDAVSSILFEHQAGEIATYRISETGFVNIVFPRNTPDLAYSVILNELLHHPDIKGVLAGKGGPVCNLYP